MTQRFVIGVDGITPAQETPLRAYFDHIGTWWHWIPNFWLVVVSENDHLSVRDMRDNVLEITGSQRVVVIEVEGPWKWAARGPKSDERNMFAWLHEFWSN